MAATTLLWALLISVSAPLTSVHGQLHAQEPKITYIYDDLGQLKRVIDDQGNVRTYNYDAVGNICSIEAGPGGCPVGPPVVTSISPPSCIAGTVCEITIEGSSLLGVAAVSEELNAPVTHCRLLSVPVTDCSLMPQTQECNTLTCRLSPSPFLGPGPVNITFSTALGTAGGSVEILPPPDLGAPGQADIWHFAASSGEVITLTMTRIINQPDGTSTLDPAVELQDSRGFRLAFDDDSGSSMPRGPGKNAVIQDFTLPATDTYIVVARGSGGTFGPYVLDIVPSSIALIHQPPEPVEPTFVFEGEISAIPEPAPPDFVFPGDIGTVGENDTFTFPADAGTVATIQVERTANNPDGTGTLDPAVELRDSRGFLLAQDDNTGTNLPPGPGRNALILNFKLPATDTYSVVAKGADGTMGPYEVKVVFGELSAQTEADTFTFPADAGTVATIEVKRVANNPDGSGSLDPAVELRDSRGFLLARDDDTGTDDPPGPGRNALIPRLTLPATDTYSVTVRGTNGSVGSYRVEVTFLSP